jgi:flagellar assembly factor FliW
MTATHPENSTIFSPWLGEIESGPDCEILFPAGLPGFEEERRMIPVEIPAQRPLVYLQSAGNARVCFVALPVYVIDRGFQLKIPEEERSLLEFPENSEPVIGEDVLCVALLMPAGPTVQVNLNSPVVINLHNRRGVQCVNSGGLPAGYRLSANNGWTRLC